MIFQRIIPIKVRVMKSTVREDIDQDLIKEKLSYCIGKEVLKHVSIEESEDTLHQKSTYSVKFNIVDVLEENDEKEL